MRRQFKTESKPKPALQLHKPRSYTKIFWYFWFEIQKHETGRSFSKNQQTNSLPHHFTWYGPRTGACWCDNPISSRYCYQVDEWPVFGKVPERVHLPTETFDMNLKCKNFVRTKKYRLKVRSLSWSMRWNFPTIRRKPTQNVTSDHF